MYKLTQKQCLRYMDSKHVNNTFDIIIHCDDVFSKCLEWAYSVDRPGSVRVVCAYKDKFFQACAKCHPMDKFDIMKGLSMAMVRLREQLVEAMNETEKKDQWKPAVGQTYWCYDSPDYPPTIRSRYASSYVYQLDIALGNCFKTGSEARGSRNKTISKLDKLIAYAKELNN